MDKSKESIFSKIKIKSSLIALGASVALTLILLAVFSFASSKGMIKLGMLPFFAGCAAVLGGFFGGIINGILAKERGIICGLINGVMLALLVLACSIIWSACFFDIFGIIKLALIVIFSIIGGIIGVNRKHKDIKY